MSIRLNDLCPYRSLLLCTCPNQWAQAAAIRELRDFADEYDNVQQVGPASTIANRHGLIVQYFYYRIEQSPAWLSSQLLTDRFHALVVLFRRGTSIAILTTEGRLRDKIRGHLSRADRTRIGALTPIPAATLSSAYVRGKTNTLWLTGTHRQVPSQVDNKAISGADLLYALDPLGDQTFFFTSAVSKLPQNAYDYKVGVSPHRSYIWGGPSEDGNTLCEGVAKLFDILHNAPANANPLPMLASPVMDVTTIGNVTNAYEAALLPGELLDHDLPLEQRSFAEKWNRLEFEIIATNGINFDAVISLTNTNGTVAQLGTIRVAFDVSKPERVRWVATQLVAAPPNARQLQAEAIDVLNARTSWFKVWFESGHTLVDQKFFSRKFRDAQFAFCFCDFTGFRVDMEKPAQLTAARIGASTSLFCWVRNRWHRALPQPGPVAGWLACNDGAMEIADFIHFDHLNGTPELSLIHIKGSKNQAPNRQISVSDYEVVVGQAVKNLRFLDLQNTFAGFTTALNAKLMDASWQAGAASTRANMVAAMGRVGPPPKRRVVIVQPRVRQTALNAARAAATNTRQNMIARQLDTLLLAAQANCRNLGAELIVIGDET